VTVQAESPTKRAYGSGSLTQRDGSWYGKWRVGGRQVSRKIGAVRLRGEATGLTRSAAEVRLRELMAEVGPEHLGSRVKDQNVRRPGRYTIGELGALYIEHAREHRGLKEGTTLTDYAATIRNHLTPFFRDTPIQQIDAKRIEAFARHLRTKKSRGTRAGRPLSPKSVANYLGTLSTLLNFAVRKKWLASSPMTAVDLPAHKIIVDGDTPIADLKFLEPHEVRRLVGAAVEGRYQALDRAMYTMAAYTGLRQGELRALVWSRVDFDRSIVHVMEGITRGRRSSPKGKRRRSVPLAPTAAQALRALHEKSPWTGPDDAVFATPSSGNPIARTELMRRYRQALVAAGLDPLFSFHDLRHTFGTTMARQGVPVGTIQAWMGHADLATTQLYMHYAPAAHDAAIIDAAFGAPPTNPPTNLR
jgi:integrase